MDELLQYIFGFWRFVFSPSFRGTCLDKFKKQKKSAKLFSVLNGCISISIGIGTPAIIVFAVFNRVSTGIALDSCLDSGGSYNYALCTCDYKQNHPFIANSKCK